MTKRNKLIAAISGVVLLVILVIAFITMTSGTPNAPVQTAIAPSPSATTVAATTTETAIPAAPATPAVNPVNGKIAYVTGNQTDVRIMDADGTNNVELINHSDPNYLYTPSWSPNGSALAMGYRDSTMVGGEKSRLAVVDAADGTVLATGPILQQVRFIDWATDIY